MEKKQRLLKSSSLVGSNYASEWLLANDEVSFENGIRKKEMDFMKERADVVLSCENIAKLDESY